MSELRQEYHHGALRPALLTEAMTMLEEGGPFSLRALARRLGVSPTAPYRHFPDRQALESALAARGMRDLTNELVALGPPRTVDDLAELAVTYVAFALRRPALFALMFGSECDISSDDRVDAATGLHRLLEAAATGVLVTDDPQGLASGAWAVAHGLAFLHLDGKLPADSSDQVRARVRSAVLAMIAAHVPND